MIYSTFQYFEGFTSFRNMIYSTVQYFGGKFYSCRISSIFLFNSVPKQRASHNDLGTPEGIPLDDKIYVWD